MKKLAFAEGLSLPMETAPGQAFGFLGRRGAGKTYAAQKLAELFLESRIPIVAIDPTGVWFGLRLGKGFDIPVFGGIHGDIPLEPTGGALVADLLADKGISAVLDVSQMTNADMQRFVSAFGERFFQRMKADPSAVHIFLEECQEFVPERPMGEEKKTLHIWSRIVKLGRNFGIGISLVSQRPQEVSKRVMNLTEVLCVFQMTGPHERKRVQEWVGEKGIDDDIHSFLPKLPVGTARIWSPQWLQVSMTARILKKRTLDASSTPKAGKRRRVGKLKPIDIPKIKEAMAATIERADQEDPAKLKARIKKLENENYALQRVPQAKDRELVRTERVKKLVEVPVLGKRHLVALHKAKDALDDGHNKLEVIRKSVQALDASYQKTGFTLMQLVNAVHEKKRPEPVQVLGARGDVRGTVAAKDTIARAQVPAPAPRSTGAKPNGQAEALSKCARALLTAIVQRHPRTTTRSQVALLSGYSVKSSSMSNGLSELRTAGLIRGGGDSMAPTSNGIAAAGDVPAMPTGDGLVMHWVDKLGRCPGAMLLAVHRAGTISKAHLCEVTGYTETSSSTSNALSELRTLELISRKEPFTLGPAFNP